ncbi:MAG: hypothetical protein SXQ77_12145 [Halobacteria archaeon]|nr:hypothetical protein [Halobacteria archaeon]
MDAEANAQAQAQTEAEKSADDGDKKMSPYPIFVALGIALTDVGVFARLGSRISPVLLVAGLLILGWSIRGMLRDSGYI